MTTIFVESTASQMLLERLLADLAPTHPLKIIHADGPDAARPLARQHLLTRRAPVVLLLDAGTTDERRVKGQQRDLEYYMGWGGMHTSYAVLQFVPEAEVVFFENPAVLQRLLGRTLPPELVEVGRFAPRKVLASLSQNAPFPYPSLLNQLCERDLKDLRGSPVVEELRARLVSFGEDRGERRTSRAS